jgi:hypothetical protein
MYLYVYLVVDADKRGHSKDSGLWVRDICYDSAVTRNLFFPFLSSHPAPSILLQIESMMLVPGQSE